MTLTAEQVAEQRKQAEELLFSGPQKLGFAKGLFFGHFNARLVLPYPEIEPDERATVAQAVADVRRFAETRIIPKTYLSGGSLLCDPSLSAPAKSRRLDDSISCHSLFLSAYPFHTNSMA